MSPKDGKPTETKPSEEFPHGVQPCVNGSFDCQGLSPCAPCREIRVQIMEKSMLDAGLAKVVNGREMLTELGEKFYKAYAENFAETDRQIAHALEEGRLRIQAEREAREEERRMKSQKTDKVDKTPAPAKASEAPPPPPPPPPVETKESLPDTKPEKNARATSHPKNGTSQTPKPEGKAPPAPSSSETNQ